MKTRTVIRARAKGAAEFYKPKGLTDVLVRSFKTALRQDLPVDCHHDWFVHVYTVKDYPEEFIGFPALNDALCYARDVRKFGGLALVSDDALLVN